ncbi:MAG: guanine-specific ribonuclease N1 and T1 [Lautropia mirabilis]|nr:guanine-specific ribonuclease N1 and T1 [Lautropia mirabilis]
MKAFVTFIRTLFNSSSVAAGGRASQQRFLSRVRWQGLARALFVLLAALLLGTGLSVLQACNGQPQPAAQPDVRASVQVSGQTAGQASDQAASRTSERAQNRVSGRASDRSSDRASRQGADGLGTVAVADLPAEARQTLALIREGGPYPYEKDGTVFGNYERKLPRQRRGYYTEYTVRTPQVRSRGARRIIAGGPDGRPTEFYYTDDHYQTFRRIEFP